jgi:hypothetical protein
LDKVKKKIIKKEVTYEHHVTHGVSVESLVLLGLRAVVLYALSE